MRDQKIRTCLLTPLTLLLLAPVLGWAQQPEVQRHLTRSQLWQTFRRTGTEGHRLDVSAFNFHDVDLMYPGYRVADRDYEEHWGPDPNKESLNALDAFYTFNVGDGHGVWILTHDPANAAKPYEVSASNLWLNTPDIVEMDYQPSKGPEKGLGLPSRSPWTKSFTANYWPGAPQILHDLAEIHNVDYNRYIANDNYPEEAVISQWTTNRGITVTRKAYAWSHRDYDDFIIIEYIFENTGDKTGDGVPDGGLPITLNNTYFSFHSALTGTETGIIWTSAQNPNQLIVPGRANGRDNWWKYSESPNFDGPAAAIGKKIVYQYDGDYPGNDWDDTYEPILISRMNSYGQQRSSRVVNGQLSDPVYIGTAPLDYMPPFTNDPETYIAPKTDAKGNGGANQPIAVQVWPIRSYNDHDQPGTGTFTDKELYLIYSGLGDSARVYRQPAAVGMFTFAMTYGPYDIPPGGKVKIVRAWVAGTGAGDKNILEWSRSSKARSEAPAGEAWMLKSLERAQYAYDNGYRVPPAPPTPMVNVKSNASGNNELTWSAEILDAANPATGKKDVVGFRVYRSDKQQAGYEIGPWTLLADIPTASTANLMPNVAFTNAAGVASSKPGTFFYSDSGSLPGFEYYYAVTSYTAAGAESNTCAPEQRVGIPRSPIVLNDQRFDRLEERVLAVPNPYMPNSPYTYGSTRIRFVNIPQKCTIRIFTVNGDLIDTIRHPTRASDPLKGETEWVQGSFNFGSEASPGLYFFVVESQVAGSEGKLSKGSFILIK